jgi:ATP-binding cassette subfamily C protein
MPEPAGALSIRRFAAMLFRAAPRAVVASGSLMVLVALTEGAGLLLLIPLLALAGVTSAPLPSSGGWGWLAARLPHSLAATLLLYVAVVGARAALELAESLAAVRVQVEVTRTLRERLYRALVRARWEVVAPLRGSRLAQVFTSELEQVSLTTNQLLGGALQLLIALTYAGAAIAISPPLAVLAATGALLLLLPARRQQRAARRDGDALTAMGAELFAGATEEVATLKVAKSAGIARRVADRFAARAGAHARALFQAHARYRSVAALLTAGAAGRSPSSSGSRWRGCTSRRRASSSSSSCARGSSRASRPCRGAHCRRPARCPRRRACSRCSTRSRARPSATTAPRRRRSWSSARSSCAT